LLVKFGMTAPGWKDMFVPTVTFISGTATQVFFPFFSTQT